MTAKHSHPQPCGLYARDWYPPRCFSSQLAAHSRTPDGPPPSRDNDTTTPIKHVIVIIGENRSFDHIFATYVPQEGRNSWNLLRKEL